MKVWLAEVWLEIGRPVAIIIGHLAVTVTAVLAVAVVEEVLMALGLSKKKVPFLDLTLSDWLYDLDVIAVTGIIGVGIVKGVRALWKG